MIKSHGATDYVGFSNSLSVCEKIVKGDLPTRYGRLRSKSKWIKLSSKKANWHPKSAAREYCAEVDQLAVSDFSKYE